MRASEPTSVTNTGGLGLTDHKPMPRDIKINHQYQKDEVVISNTFFTSNDKYSLLEQCKHVIVGSGPCGYSFLHHVLLNGYNDLKVGMVDKGGLFLQDHFQTLDPVYSGLIGPSEVMDFALPREVDQAKKEREEQEGKKKEEDDLDVQDEATQLLGQVNQGVVDPSQVVPLDKIYQHGNLYNIGGRSVTWTCWCPDPELCADDPLKDELRGFDPTLFNEIKQHLPEAKKLLCCDEKSNVTISDPDLLKYSNDILNIIKKDLPVNTNTQSKLLNENVVWHTAKFASIAAVRSESASNYGKFTTVSPILKLASSFKEDTGANFLYILSYKIIGLVKQMVETSFKVKEYKIKFTSDQVVASFKGLMDTIQQEINMLKRNTKLKDLVGQDVDGVEVSVERILKMLVRKYSTVEYQQDQFMSQLKEITLKLNNYSVEPQDPTDESKQTFVKVIKFFESFVLAQKAPTNDQDKKIESLIIDHLPKRQFLLYAGTEVCKLAQIENSNNKLSVYINNDEQPTIQLGSSTNLVLATGPFPASNLLLKSFKGKNVGLVDKIGKDFSAHFCSSVVFRVKKDQPLDICPIPLSMGVISSPDLVDQRTCPALPLGVEYNNLKEYMNAINSTSHFNGKDYAEAIYISGCVKDKQTQKALNEWHAQLSVIYPGEKGIRTENTLRRILPGGPDSLANTSDPEYYYFNFSMLGELLTRHYRVWAGLDDAKEDKEKVARYNYLDQPEKGLPNTVLDLDICKTDNESWGEMTAIPFSFISRWFPNTIVGLRNKSGEWEELETCTKEFEKVTEDIRTHSYDKFASTGFVHEASLHPIGKKSNTTLSNNIPNITINNAYTISDEECPVGTDYQLKGVPNVYLTGAGLLPNCGSWNPTLFISAMAVDLAHKLSNKINQIKSN
ncbi:hypothetical protein DFA_10764 [Cavenderia fasciculata]|uniref:Glucose-methanol-choline oxidoreductase C-terminal domain-containing protein n=1 Tax=Cavenderia fasciculata TaxID=261658 RepID=F4QBB9_CACFS|nr:uncharacterized protein DFA_10764 [Cavenderia fasciculata]EGG14891.1 hypothetical protein DFA_10764 [Cavenderia fasciculata]|eukprot:XP_004351407.1 hypothetical protein DFA_10764 [Cavenderia fasciculata]